MTVWVVCLNDRAIGVAASRDAAGRIMQRVRADHPRLKKEAWRAIGQGTDPDGWASENVTSLTRRAYELMP